MGQYRSAVITDAGQALLADAISGSGTVTFSAVKTSSYAYPQGTNIAGLTDLQDIVQTVTPFSGREHCQQLRNGQCGAAPLGGPGQGADGWQGPE